MIHHVLVSGMFGVVHYLDMAYRSSHISIPGRLHYSVMSLIPRLACARCVLHVIDTDPSSLSAGGWLEDVSKVEKYEISDEAYNLRENTYRKFKEKKLQVRSFNDDPMFKATAGGVMSHEDLMLGTSW